MKNITPSVMCVFLLTACIHQASSQPRWMEHGGPNGGTILDFAPSSVGLLAVPSYRPHLLIGYFQGSQWIRQDLPDVTAMGFSVAEFDGRIIVGGFGRVYLSDDRGATWIERRVSDVDVSPITALAAWGERWYLTVGSTMFSSTDRGMNWEPNVVFPEARVFQFIQVTHSGRLYAAGPTGLYYRPHWGGVRFDTVHAAPKDIRCFLGRENGVFVAARGYDPSTPDAPILYRSTDLGEHWGACLFPRVEVLDLACNGPIWFASTTQGLYRSTDDGLRWDEVQAGTPFPRRVSSLYVYENKLYAGVDGMGIWRSGDDGITWEFVSDGALPIGIAQVEETRQEMLALSFKERALFRSSDRGFSWTPSFPPIGEGTGGMLVEGDSVWVAGRGTVHRSTDAGATWSTASDGIPEDLEVQALHNAQGRLVAGSKGGGMLHSEDGGRQWTIDTNVKPVQCYHFLEVDGVLYAATQGSLLTSTDAGVGWESLRRSSSNNLFYRLAEFANTLLCATEDGVHAWIPTEQRWETYYSAPAYAIATTVAGVFAITRDDGVIRFSRDFSHFTRVNDGLPEVRYVAPSVCRAELRALGTRLYLGSCGLPGLYSLDLTTLPVTALPTAGNDVVFGELYPVPARDVAELRISLARAGTVELQCVDVLGRVLLHERRELYSTGTHHLSLKLPDGIGSAMLLRIRAGGAWHSRLLPVHR